MMMVALPISSIVVAGGTGEVAMELVVVEWVVVAVLVVREAGVVARLVEHQVVYE